MLITFGGLLGKTSPTQLLGITILEIVFFALNERIGLVLGVSDIGGSMVIHTFGAYFGLAASLILSPRDAGRSDNAAVYRSDLFAMIGTLFLWMYWPSFNAAMQVDHMRQRAVINTILSICGSCVAAFLASKQLRHDKQFSMVDIQNATLAGGVAVGAVADLMLHPVGGLIVSAHARAPPSSDPPSLG